MLTESKAYSGFSVNDVEAARTFYGQTLGLRVTDPHPEFGVFSIELAGDRPVLVYPKGDDHTPASFTILNFPVDDIDKTVDELTARGVEFLRYDNFPQDDKGVMRGMGPNIAWFTDPAGNVLAILEDS